MTTPSYLQYHCRHHQRQQQQQRRPIYNLFIMSLFLLINNINSFHIPSHHQRTTTTIHPFITPPHPLPSQNQRHFHHSPTTTTKTRLSSLSKLLSEIKTKTKTPRVIFVGGKGGVGKTTISSALAVSLASSLDNEDENILIVSTDPAHSLGDALDIDLRSSGGDPVVLSDPLTAGRLSACELDPLRALDDFRSKLDAFDVDTLASALGVSASFLETLGLREFANLLDNPPPGLDELVALAQILSPSSGLTAPYTTIIIDTAPTGHTLRLLSLPTFLDSFLGKLVSLRARLSSVAGTLQKFFGSEDAARRTRQWDAAVEKLEELKKSMSVLRESLKDGEKTSFMVVTVATGLGVAESLRLMKELRGSGVRVTDVVVNQLMDDQDDDLMTTYYTRRQSSQKKWIASMRDAMADVSASEEYQRNNGGGGGTSSSMALIEVPYFDVELVGVAALEYVGRTCFREEEAFRHLMEEEEGGEDSPKFIICGGKGGVGKTTTSATLAITLASSNHNVALISTDPAHSLGDALDTNLSGGNLTPLPLSSPGSLTALEIDPAQSLQKFKSLVDSLVPSTTSTSERAKLSATLSDIGSLFDTLPAGTDEVVALAQIVSLLKRGSYDRIVLDTAPTGHTLRMLSTPAFVAELIDRVLVIAETINSNAVVNMFVNSAVGERKDDVAAVAAAAKSALLDFQMQMYDLEDVLSDPESTEFLIVTIPTELAVRESVRLLNDLTFDGEDVPVKVRTVVVNQVLDEGLVDVGSWGRRVKGGQERSLGELVRGVEEDGGVEVTRVRYLDTEPRGVYGLKALEGELLEG